MNIGFLLTDEHRGQGGLENVLITIVNGLKAKGITSTIFLLRAPEQASFLEEFDNIHVMPPFIDPNLANKMPKILYHQIWKYRFITHSHQFLMTVLEEAKIDALILLNLSKDFVRITPTLKAYKKRHPNIPFIAWPHGSISILRNRVRQTLTKNREIFDATFAISQGLARELTEILRLPNVHVIYNPVATANIIPRDASRFIFIGRIGDPGKRLKLLLQVMSKLHGKWHLDIVGSSGNETMDAEIRDYASQLNIDDKLTFHGWKADPWADIQSMGALILNSLSEGFGLVLVEAMMRGIPAISSDCPVGPGEIIVNDCNGWLFEINDILYLQILLQQIIDEKRQLPDQEKIIKSVQKFSEPVVVERFINHLIAIIDKQ